MSRRLVMNRIRYLRSRYSTRRRALQRNPDLVTPDWFADMESFLSTFYPGTAPLPKRPTTSTTTNATINVPGNQQCTSNIICGSANRGGDAGKPSTDAERTVRQQQILQHLDQQVQQSMRALRSLAEEEAAAKIAAATETAERLNRSTENGGGNSEFDVFGRNVSLQLGKLGLSEALHCQLAIQSVLRTFRLRQQQHQQSQQLTSATAANSTSPSSAVLPAIPYPVMATGPHGSSFAIQSMAMDDDDQALGQLNACLDDGDVTEINAEDGDGGLLQELLGASNINNGHSRKSHVPQQKTCGLSNGDTVIVDIASDTSDDED